MINAKRGGRRKSVASIFRALRLQRRGSPTPQNSPYPPLTPPSEVSEGARRKNARSAHNPPQAIMTHNRKAAVLAFMIRLCRIIAFGSVGGGPRTRNARRRIHHSEFLIHLYLFPGLPPPPKPPPPKPPLPDTPSLCEDCVQDRTVLPLHSSV